VVVAAALQDRGQPVAPLTVGTGALVTGRAPARVPNFSTCRADDAALEYLPVEIRLPAPFLAGTVAVQAPATTPPGIGRLGFFFESGDKYNLPCSVDTWSTTDSFANASRVQVITGYVVLDRAVTPSTPRGRPDVFATLRLRISDLRFHDVAVPPLTISTPTVGELCPGTQDAICAPLG
jgi:hypothetical protein